MVFLPNPPEADKSLRLPCEMRSLFLWGYAQKITRHRTLADKSSEYQLYASGYFFRMPWSWTKILIYEWTLTSCSAAELYPVIILDFLVNLVNIATKTYKKPFAKDEALTSGYFW